MSGAVYKIVTQYEPHAAQSTLPWVARIVRLSDDVQVGQEFGPTRFVAEGLARELIALWASQDQSEQTTYADDEGNVVEPHSVRA